MEALVNWVGWFFYEACSVLSICGGRMFYKTQSCPSTFQRTVLGRKSTVWYPKLCLSYTWNFCCGFENVRLIIWMEKTLRESRFLCFCRIQHSQGWCSEEEKPKSGIIIARLCPLVSGRRFGTSSYFLYRKSPAACVLILSNKSPGRGTLPSMTFCVLLGKWVPNWSSGLLSKIFTL